MFQPPQRTASLIAVCLLAASLCGCSAVARQAVPATCVRPVGSQTPRSDREPINFALLRQVPPPVHLIGPRDVLGIFIEGVLGQRDQAPPVHFPDPGQDLPPAMGFPVPVREDGTVSLPLIEPIPVAGLTLAQAEEEIRAAYMIRRKILQPGRERIIVTLIEPRTYSVLVIREDSAIVSGIGSNPRGQQTQGILGATTLGTTKLGAAQLVELPAYQNDVLHALSQAGGLPGLDARNEVLILRGGFKTGEDQQRLAAAGRDPATWREVWENNPYVTRIPLRIGPTDPPVHVTPEEIILNTGDIVYIQGREAEVFYTGGLLQGGQFPIPRDYDLDVLGAIAMAGGSVAASPGGTGSQAVNGGRGVGSIFPPTRVIVLRQVNGQPVPIKLNLKTAMLDPRQRLLIQPNDHIILEYTETEVALNVVLSAVTLNYSLNNN